MVVERAAGAALRARVALRPRIVGVAGDDTTRSPSSSTIVPHPTAQSRHAEATRSVIGHFYQSGAARTPSRAQRADGSTGVWRCRREHEEEQAGRHWLRCRR